jgi:hypothetical protein
MIVVTVDAVSAEVLNGFLPVEATSYNTEVF